LTEANTLKLVLDQGVPREAAMLLRALNYECVHVGEIGMWSATDEQILAFAEKTKATIVTLGADFHAMLAVSGSNQPSVIRIRMQGMRAPETSHLIQ
jgi:predicted nuclease of predicted toxin-antitoxin system